MSGTSTDGVDGLLLDCAAPPQKAVLAFASRSFAHDLRAEFLALNQAGENELHRAALAANALARVYAQVVADLLAQTGLRAKQILAIGAHGQTVRHQPQMHDGCGYTLQINQAALLAELTGITTIADFRSRDIAAGGQHRGENFDEGGRWAASGRVQAPLLAQMLSEPYFQQRAPKSTGRDLFSLAWLEQHLQIQTSAGIKLAAEDVQATLLELTARSIADSLATARGLSSPLKVSGALIVCGGGAYNLTLMQRLQSLLPHALVQSSQAYGLAPNQVEAAAFAWLAQATLERRALPVSGITGARGARVLGCIYPA